MYRHIPSIRVIYCSLFLLVGDTHGLQLAIRNMYEFKVHVFSIIIPCPNSPGRNIDVYLRLLIDGLKQLWSFEALTYDVSRKQNFQMKAALMLTINYFSVYRIVFGWSTHRKLLYTYCIENNKIFTLTNSGKRYF